MLTVLKLGGELLDDAASLHGTAGAIVRLSRREPVVIVHGGGRAIDAELKARGLTPKFVDGLRITDEAAMGSVLAVLAGRTNTTLVAALGAAGGKGVGLTGADGWIGLATRAPVFESASGERVDLGLVGQPESADLQLLRDLLRLGYTPVVASIGVSATGDLLNVNADTLAGHLAATLPATRLIIAGGTPGVLDANDKPIARLTVEDIDAMIAAGTAHSGMVAKLTACRRALAGGVTEVSVVSGRGVQDYEHAVGTRIQAGHADRAVVI